MRLCSLSLSLVMSSGYDAFINYSSKQNRSCYNLFFFLCYCYAFVLFFDYYWYVKVAKYSFYLFI